jgi:hypothetical protein
MASTNVLCMLSEEQPFPADMFHQMFPVSAYDFPHLDKDHAGFVSHDPTHRWAAYNLFRIQDSMAKPVTDPVAEERDMAVEEFMVATGITEFEIDLQGPPLLDRRYRTVHCYMAPQSGHKTVLFDILYQCDHLFKYFYRYFVQLVFQGKPFAEVGGMDFIFAHGAKNGFVNVTRTLRRAGFTALKNQVRLFSLRHKAEVPQWTAAFGKYDDQEFRVQLTFDEVAVTVSPDGAYFQIHDLVPTVLVGPNLPDDHPGLVFKQFVQTHYPALKRAFPLYQRLETVVKWCAVNKFLKPERPATSTTPIFVDSFVDSIHGLGGIKGAPRIIHPPVPFIQRQPRFTSTASDPVARVHVIRRNLQAFPFKAGAVAHSGLLLVTEKGQRCILEYGIDTGNGKRGTVLRPVAEGEALYPLWTQQEVGAAPDGSFSVEDVKAIMEGHGSQKAYDIQSHNCHLAQEATRRSLGIKVEQPYAPLW